MFRLLRKPSQRGSIQASICLAWVLLLTIFFQPGALAASPLSQAQQEAEPHSPPQSQYAWAPALLYGIISAPNPLALNSLYDAAFAAGPPLVPDLVAALKDDRTATFAAQSMAFIGSKDAFRALSQLVNDPRDLDLRRFYYGALGEFGTPQANDYLLNVIRRANHEPDRTVTEAAILALTVQTNAMLAPQLQQVETRLTDPVIQDDLENAINVIQARAKYLARVKNPGGSIQQALHVYFEPALTAPSATSHGAPHHAVSLRAQVRIRHLVFNPDRSRALARVLYEYGGVSERYIIVFQKRYGNWTVASVWLSGE